MIQSCPTCEAVTDAKLLTLMCKATVGGREIEWEGKSYQCSRCKEWFDTAETLDANLAAARDKMKIVTTKKWYQSRTLWAGVVVVLGAVGDAVINGLGWRQCAVIAFGALVAYLRTVTSEPIK